MFLFTPKSKNSLRVSWSRQYLIKNNILMVVKTFQNPQFDCTR